MLIMVLILEKLGTHIQLIYIGKRFTTDAQSLNPHLGLIQIWNYWKDVWSTSKWQEKSDKAKKNRNTKLKGPGIGVVKHIGGSRCFVEHSIKMREELNRDTTAYELFKKLHQKKDGMWVDAKSKAVDDEMNERLLEFSRPGVDGGLPQTPTIECMNEIYMHAAGGVRKKSLYGIGSQAFLTFPDAMSGRGPRARTSSYADVAAARAEVAAANSKVEELTQQLTSLQLHVRYLMEHAIIDPQSTQVLVMMIAHKLHPLIRYLVI